MCLWRIVDIVGLVVVLVGVGVRGVWCFIKECILCVI